MITHVGVDRVRGSHEGEVCLMAIGLQPIGNLVTRDRAGRFASLTRLRGLGRTIVGACTEVEPAEPPESRPNPRPAPRATRGAAAVRAVVALTLVVVATAPTRDTLGRVVLATAAWLAVAGAGVALTGAARFVRWADGYVRREFVAQWRLGLMTLVPCAAFLAWVATR